MCDKSTAQRRLEEQDAVIKLLRQTLDAWQHAVARTEHDVWVGNRAHDSRSCVWCADEAAVEEEKHRGY